MGGSSKVIKSNFGNLHRNHLAYGQKTHRNFKMSFVIKPSRTLHGWTNIMHMTKSNNNCCNALDRIPAIWFFDRSTRMHVRMGRPHSGNDGCNTGRSLALNKWSKVTVSLFGSRLSVRVKQLASRDEHTDEGAEWCASGNYHHRNSGYTNVRAYYSDPWYCGRCSIRQLQVRQPELQANRDLRRLRLPSAS